MIENFLEKAKQIVAEHRAQYKGVYYMKGGVGGALKQVGNVIKDEFGAHGWTGIRDAAETGAVLTGNYLLPGSALLTSNLVSKGSKKELNTGIGKLAQVGTGLAGAGVGSSVTGVPQSAGGALEGAALSSVGNTLGGLTSSAENALGLTDAAGTAEPWINPDLATAASGATDASTAAGTAAPWINPDAIAPGTTASTASPWINPDTGSTIDALGNPVDTVNPNNLTAGETNFLNKAQAAANSPVPAGGISDVLQPAASKASGLSSSLLPALGLAGAAKNLLAPAISGAGLALAASEGNKKTPAEQALTTQAGQEATAGQQLQKYLPSGTLPPGAQAGIDQAANSAKAAIRSRYASMGMSGSSPEQQELAAVDSSAQAQGEQLALQLLNTGINESSLSSQIYQNLMGNQLQQDQNLSSAISNFAGSIAGGSKPSGITVNI